MAHHRLLDASTSSKGSAFESPLSLSMGFVNGGKAQAGLSSIASKGDALSVVSFSLTVRVWLAVWGSGLRLTGFIRFELWSIVMCRDDLVGDTADVSSKMGLGKLSSPVCEPG